MRRYHVILNARSGTALASGLTSEALQEQFAGLGRPITIDAESHLPLVERLERARRSDADVIVAAGGDGTVTAVAGALMDTDKTLAILPLGTVNLLARDLGIPLDLPRWMAEVEAMEPLRVDVGEVNGQVFLHKVVAGIIPGIAAGREQIRGRAGWGTKIAFIQFFLRRLFRARRMAVEIADPSGAAQIKRVAAVAVANNAYDEALGRFFARQRLDRGYLTLYLLKHLNFGDVVRLAMGMVLGRWRRDEALEIETADALTLRTKKGKLKVMLDGEVMLLDMPLSFRVRPLALSVLAPVAAEVAAPEAPVAAES